MSKSQIIKIERKNESKKIKYLVYSTIFAAAILAMVMMALLITNTENIKTKAGIEIVNEILELRDSVNPERDIVSSILFQMKLINQSILELNSSLLYLRNEMEQLIEEQLPELSSMGGIQIQELSSNLVELNQSVNELATMTQQQIKEISSNVDELSTQVESNSASINRLTVRVQILNHTLSIGYISPSCSAIILENPFAPSGYYWVQSSNGSAIRVYCDMTRTCGNITGGWMRTAEVDMRRTLSQCPPGLCLNNRNCRICSYEGSCSLDVYPVGVNYSRVCGRVIGYQVGSPDAFSLHYSSGVDGVQLTYGNPPMNIWAFAAAVDNSYGGLDFTSVCPCINQSDSRIQPVPSSFGNNYFCDSLPSRTANSNSNNPLWDGADCGNQNSCCSFNNPPWFYRKLPRKTNEDIEMRVCRNENRNNEDIVIEIVDIFVL